MLDVTKIICIDDIHVVGSSTTGKESKNIKYKQIKIYNQGMSTSRQQCDMACFLWNTSICNDINVFHRTLVFNDVLEGRALKVSYVVNGCIMIEHIISLMTYIIHGPHLWSQILLLHWSESTNWSLISHFFNAHVLFGTSISWKESWWLVLLCTIR